MVLGRDGSEQGSTGCQNDELSENIWLVWSLSSNYLIFEEGNSDCGQTDKRTNGQTEGASKKNKTLDWIGKELIEIN